MKTNPASIQSLHSLLRSSLVLMASLLVALPGAAQPAGKPVVLRIGTIAPGGSLYHNHLAQLARSWENAPGANLEVKIITGGASEAELVKLMRLGTINGALLTGIGLADIDPMVSGLQVSPLGFRSLDELVFVRDKFQPRLEAGLKEKGFVPLFWADTGWVRYFSKEPVLSPADLRKTKVFAWAGDPQQLELMRAIRLQPVPLETDNIMVGLSQGTINAASLAPLHVLAIQADRHAPHMLDLDWAPLLGALIVSRRSWDRIPANPRRFMQLSAAQAGQELTVAARKSSDDAVKAMQKRGLKVLSLTPELEAEWRTEVETTVHPRIRGKLVPVEIFDEIQQLLEGYRRDLAKGSAGSADGRKMAPETQRE